MIFSRFLYILDEVEYSFVDAMVHKRSLEAAYFWISEYYFTEYYEEAWEIIWRLFYDFYAIIHPKYEALILEKYQGFAIEDIMFVVKQLYPLKTNHSVFQLRNSNPSKPTKRYGGRIPSWAQENTDIVLSIHFNHIQNIAHYFSITPVDELYKIIQGYFTNVRKISLNEPPKIPYTNKKHILMALVYHLSLDEKDINTTFITTSLTDKEVDDIYAIEDDDVTPVRKTLVEKMRFGVSPFIGCFDLARFKSDISVNEAFWYHWMYYAYKAPLWKNRFKKYTIRINDVSKEIQFGSADEFEEFTEKYNYEPDELPKEVQMRSIKPIENLDMRLFVKN
tara:strand:- start:2988 stop:3992 length:1005 start_codon:yes stop_codon:yes gene_type:complete